MAYTFLQRLGDSLPQMSASWLRLGLVPLTPAGSGEAGARVANQRPASTTSDQSEASIVCPERAGAGDQPRETLGPGADIARWPRDCQSWEDCQDIARPWPPKILAPGRHQGWA